MYSLGLSNADFSYKHDSVEDSTFQLVDTAKQQKGRFGGKNTKLQQQRSQAQRRQGAIVRTAKGMEPQFAFNSSKAGRRGPGAGRIIAGRNNKFGGGNQKGGRFFQNRKSERMPSLTVGSDWEMIEEFDLQQLLKLVANPPTVDDLVWAGHLDQYDESYDKVTSRAPRVLKRVDNKVFYAVTTADDPILEKFAVEELGNVYATDAILAHLMASPRSLYSWDIVVQKMGDFIYLDKREDSVFDFLTVSETAHEPPTANEETEDYNYPEKLSIEATMINQNFSQQVLRSEGFETRKTYEPNPFFEDDESGVEPASVAYRYRKFTLGNIKIISRCELHAWMPKNGADTLLTCYSLNEWDSKYAGGVNWRQKIDQQRGAVLATELKNNSNKLAKWTAQSILAGADQMKVGYVSRVAPTNNYDHVILATQYFKPKELATQINLSVNNMWGIIKMLSELLLSKDDGKYVIMKDPNKATVRIYAVPINAFDEDEEQDEEDEVQDAEQAEEEA